MIIHAPTLKSVEDQIQITSRFEMRKPLPYLPDELWYRFPEVYQPSVALRADGFAATGLLVAMYAGEDLAIRGPISPKLAYGLLEYRTIFHSWNPGLFKMVDLQYDQLEPVPQLLVKPDVATAFSGGVDSFYTLWSHLPVNQPLPHARVTHGLFLHGIDLRLDDESNYTAISQEYQRIFEELGLVLITAATNAYQFSEFRINWTMFHGAPTIGAALILSQSLGCFYIPSGFPTYAKLVPNGVSPLTDHLLSTETLDVIHHATDVERFDKIKVLVDWPITHHRLRVCADKHRLKGFENCSACHKCYRTTTILVLLNALPKYHNFSQKLTVKDYFRWGFHTLLNVRQARSIQSQAWQAGRYGMVMLIQVAIILRKFKKSFMDILKHLLTPDQLYQIKRKVFKPESDNVSKVT